MTSKLTQIFKQLKKLDDARDSRGAQILAFLVEMQCETLEQANEQFGKAYDENGWSRTAGRPKDGTTEVPAPPTVKNYVTAFRTAYGYNLDVLAFKTVGEMRRANREMRQAEKEAQEKPASLVGVQLTKQDVLTGALVHDISAVIAHLPEGQRNAFESKLQRLLNQYMRKASADLRIVA